MMTSMNLDYETVNAVMEISNKLAEKLANYFKENYEQIVMALASMNPTCVPAFAR
ncbi:MAG: hypothetical protein HFH23_14485 [Ruminococcus sp.]|nr:hypothetical protein [Ruminococcus sp.]